MANAGAMEIPKDEIPSLFVPPHCSKPVTGNGKSPIPNYQPDDLSFYANIPVPTSYMCMGSKQDFFGGYDYFAQAGIVHVANHHIAPGKKQWTWGNHEFGYAWDRNLTDADGRGEFAPYIEIMAGVYSDNQPDFSFLQPGETKSWSQYWYPIQKIGPAQHANIDAAISLRLENGELHLGVAVTSHQPDATVLVTAKGKEITRLARDISPATPLVEKIPLKRSVLETDLLIRVTDTANRELISYQPVPRAKIKVPAACNRTGGPRRHSEQRRTFSHRLASGPVSPRHPLARDLLARSVAPRSAGCALQ